MGLRPPAPCITLQCGHGPLKAARPVTLASTASPFSALGRMKHSDCHTKISTSGISPLEAKPSILLNIGLSHANQGILGLPPPPLFWALAGVSLWGQVPL